MPTIYPEVCLYCKHLFDENSQQHNYKCKAFPKGVPEEIYQGLYDHRYQYPNDSGTTFELRDDYVVHQDEVNRMFKTIEGVRRITFENPHKKNPTSYDWWKSESDEESTNSTDNNE